MLLLRLQHISRCPMSWCSQTSAFLCKILWGPSMPKSQSSKITEFLRGSRMPKSQTKLSNKQAITFKMLVTSHGQKIDGKCFGKNCNIFLCTPYIVLDGKCFCKDCNVFPSTPCHVIHKKCHLCKITEFYKDHGCQSHIQRCQLYRRLLS